MFLKFILALILAPVFLLMTMAFLFSIRPLREFLLRLLGRQISKAAQRGQMRMEVRTWRFGSARDFDFETPITPKSGPPELVSEIDVPRPMKDVGPLPPSS